MLKVPKHIYSLKYLVVGTGRCGTVYMSRLLTQLGYMCGHEAIFNYEGLPKALARLKGEEEILTSHCSQNDLLQNKPLDDWFDLQKISAESSYMAVPFLDCFFLKNTKRIHVVRHPLKVISSHVLDVKFFSYPNPKQQPWQNFVLETLPEIKEIRTEIERACYYYVHWNKLISNAFIHKVEDNYTPELANFLGIEYQPVDVSEKNSWKKRDKDLELSDIPEGSIKKEFIIFAQELGYGL